MTTPEIQERVIRLSRECLQKTLTRLQKDKDKYADLIAHFEHQLNLINLEQCLKK